MSLCNFFIQVFMIENKNMLFWFVQGRVRVLGDKTSNDFMKNLTDRPIVLFEVFALRQS